MKNTIIALFFATTSICSAQNSDKKFMIKAYSGFQSVVQQNFYDHQAGQTYSYTKYVTQNIMPFSPAFCWLNSDGDMHEFELTNLSFKREDDEHSQQKYGEESVVLSAKTTYTNKYGLKYKFTYRLFKSKTWKLRPNLGYGPLMLVSYNAVIPMVSTSARYRETDIITYMHIEPGFEIVLPKKLSLNFSLPVAIASLNLNRKLTFYEVDPELSSQNLSLSFDFFPKFYQLKLAFGYKF